MYRLSVIFLALLAACTSARAQSPATQMNDHPAQEEAFTDALTLLDIWIRNRIVDREQPGLSIGVVLGDKLVWEKGYGTADLEHTTPAGSKTLYRIASISKTFTATAILQLRDAGKLHLNDPVRDHLSWFQVEGEYDRPITIWHLLTHTSGLPREAVGVDWVDLSFPHRTAMVDGIRRQRPVYLPETQWKYSNLGFSIAGEVVAAVSGQTWDGYISEHILEPLAMASTTTAPEEDMAGLATGYSRRSQGEPRSERPWVDLAAERPAGNMASNVEDLARYLAFHLSEDDAVLAPVTRAEMHRVHWLLDSWEQGWGLGFNVERKGSYHIVGHGGALPGHRTEIAFAPEYGLGIIVLTNAADGDPATYRDMAFDLLIPVLNATRERNKLEAEPATELDPYVGTYSSPWGDMTVLVYRGRLAIAEHGPGNPAESLIELRPVGEHAFQGWPTAMHYVANGEVFRFTLDQSGRAVGVRTESSSWKRVD